MPSNRVGSRGLKEITEGVKEVLGSAALVKPGPQSILALAREYTSVPPGWIHGRQRGDRITAVHTYRKARWLDIALEQCVRAAWTIWPLTRKEAGAV